MAGIRPEIIKAFQECTTPLPYLTITILGFAAGNAFGGQGGTYGRVISSFSAKSETYKSLRKLAIVPSIFNINEPLIFGATIMMNPIFFIPFVFGPVVMGTAAFLKAKILNLTFLNPTAEVPCTMPSIFHAFLVGGWKYLVIIAIVIIIVNVALWYPFFKISDNELFEEEQAKA